MGVAVVVVVVVGGAPFEILVRYFGYAETPASGPVRGWIDTLPQQGSHSTDLLRLSTLPKEGTVSLSNRPME